MESDADLVERPPETADETDVMREQLEYLIDHIAGHESCDCSECRRYLRTRAVLLEIFGDPAPMASVNPGLHMAA
jgi:hypothetical protein